jgi:hypothetical protein
MRNSGPVHSLAAVLADLATAMTSGWSWPSPEVGFARYVYSATGDPLPFHDDAGDWPVGERLDLAPALASAGYLLASGRGGASLTPQMWIEGLDRLSGREAFTADRLSFAYRPLEVLGIALGAASYPAIETNLLSWLTAVIERLRQEVVADPWTDLLHETAADALNVRWRERLFFKLDGAAIEVLALLRWIVSTRSTASFADVNDRRRLDAALLRQALVEPIKRTDVARAAVLHQSLRRAAEEHVAAAAPAASRQGLIIPTGAGDVAIDTSILQQVPPGTTVQIQFIQGGQHVGDKINIAGDNIGGAVGRSAAVIARDITVFKQMLDSSAHLDQDLREKLFKAREEVERTSLSPEDKQDVTESLKRLAIELNKPQQDASVIRRFWNRVKEIAPTVAAILSSAVAVAKLTGHG